MTATVETTSGPFVLRLELERGDLLPGRLVAGSLRITGHDAGEFRAARVTLVGVETWRYDQTTVDMNGQPHTQTRTNQADLPHVPVALLGPTTIGRGEIRDVPFQLPVPGLGPATFEATELRVDWELRANLDVRGFDREVVLPVKVHQPTALVQAGVIDLAEFALWPDAAFDADGFRGSISLDPAPLCVGSAFQGRLVMESGASRMVQEVRLEIRVHVKTTGSGGRDETILLWTGSIAGRGTFGGGPQTIDFESTLPDRWLPTIRTEHGRADAQLHVVIATAFASDPHLVRDVAIASTAEL